MLLYIGPISPNFLRRPVGFGVLDCGVWGFQVLGLRPLGLWSSGFEEIRLVGSERNCLPSSYDRES